MKTLTLSTTKYDTLVRKTFWALVSMIVIAVLSYTILVNKTVLNIVSREKDQSQLSQIRTHVAELETEQIALKETVDEEMAAQLGFHEVQDPQYLSLGETTATQVSYNR